MRKKHVRLQFRQVSGVPAGQGSKRAVTTRAFPASCFHSVLACQSFKAAVRLNCFASGGPGPSCSTAMSKNGRSSTLVSIMCLLASDIFPHDPLKTVQACRLARHEERRDHVLPSSIAFRRGRRLITIKRLLVGESNWSRGSLSAGDRLPRRRFEADGCQRAVDGQSIQVRSNWLTSTALW